MLAFWLVLIALVCVPLAAAVRMGYRLGLRERALEFAVAAVIAGSILLSLNLVFGAGWAGWLASAFWGSVVAAVQMVIAWPVGWILWHIRWTDAEVVTGSGFVGDRVSTALPRDEVGRMNPM